MYSSVKERKREVLLQSRVPTTGRSVVSLEKVGEGFQWQNVEVEKKNRGWGLDKGEGSCRKGGGESRKRTPHFEAVDGTRGRGVDRHRRTQKHRSPQGEPETREREDPLGHEWREGEDDVIERKLNERRSCYGFDELGVYGGELWWRKRTPRLGMKAGNWLL